ncbi:MAG: SWIM zinc finger family protein [Halobaculum sp.]
MAFPTRVAKRAQYEAFEFTLVDGDVRVRNGSHANPSEHEYLVTVEDGLPAACECPADDAYEGACKHRVAVAIRRPLLDAVSANEQPVAADGGRFSSANQAADDRSTPDEDEVEPGSDSDADATDCGECLDEFPCWECVRTGRKALPE